MVVVVQYLQLGLHLWSISTISEVFTPPPHSTWSLHGVYIIPHRLHVDSMEYVLAVIPLILGSPFHLDSTWNDDGMAKFHME